MLLLQDHQAIGFVADARNSHDAYAVSWVGATMFAKEKQPPIPFGNKHPLEALFETRGKIPKRSYGRRKSGN